MKKYFFFDIDGTLSCKNEFSVPESTLECLEKLRANRHFVSIATGRVQKSAARVAESLNIDTFVSDGGYSLTVDGKIVNMEYLPTDTCFKFIKHLDDIGMPWSAMTENDYVCHSRDTRFMEALGGAFLNCPINDDYEFYRTASYHKIFIVCTPENEHKIDWHGMPHVRFDNMRMFIEPTDKAYGIKMLMDRFNAPIKDVVVFGDGTNDLSMFIPDWQCIAMGNACDELKAVADHITDDCDKDGIFNACKKFGWI